MKNKNAFFTFLLALAFTLPMYAQYTPDTIAKVAPKQHDMLSMMGKPTFEATSGDVHFNIWIMTQEDHQKIMKEMNEKGMGMDKGMKGMNEKDMGMGKDMEGMKDKNLGMDKDMNGMKDKGMGMKKDTNAMKSKGMMMDKDVKDAMMAGTHNIIIEVKSTLSGKEAENATSAKVEIVSPSNKNSSVDLKMPMANHFGGGLTLDEKGEYQLKVSVGIGGVSKTMQLKYTVK